MSKQVEKIKELIAKREQARLGGGERYYSRPPGLRICSGLHRKRWFTL